MAPSDLRYFTEDWTITIPAYPELSFIRLTPFFYDEFFLFVSNPKNLPFPGKEDRQWTSEHKQAGLQRIQDRYILSKTKHQGLDFIVHRDGKLVSWGGVSDPSDIVKGLANITLAIDENLRAQGVGKAIMGI